jgi:autotransporter-associated beta strand protein
MSAPWLRRLFNKKFAQKPVQPVLRRLNLETLEDRSVPAIATWTGALVADTTDANGNAIAGNLRWSEAGNWLNGQRPTDNDDVIFPAGTPTTSTFFGGANSRMDMNITISTLTINAAGYTIVEAAPPMMGGGGGGGGGGGTPATLNITGAITANYTGTSQIHFDYRLSGNAQQINVGSGGTLISAGDVENATGVSTVGILKSGAGTLSFSADKNSGSNVGSGGAANLTVGSQNLFTGVVVVDQGTLVATAVSQTILGVTISNSPLGTLDGATVVRSGATLGVVTIGNGAALAESLEITGAGVGGAGALTGDGTISGGVTITNSASVGVLAVPGATANTLIRSNLTISGAVSGGTSTPAATSLTKVGGGILTLSGANTFLGDVLVSDGILRVSNDAALSPLGGVPAASEVNPASGGITRVANGATVELRGTRTINTETFVITGAGAPDANNTTINLGALYATTGGGGGNSTATVGNKVILAGNASIGNVDTAALVFDSSATPALATGGMLFGTAALTKLGQGTATFATNNPGFSGNVNIDNGVVVLRVAQGLGVNPRMGPPTTITVNSVNGIAGTLQVIGTELNVTKGLTLNGSGYNSQGALRVVEVTPGDATTNTSVTWAGPWTIGSTTTINVQNEASLLVSGRISGGAIGANIERNGTGTMTITGKNTYLGALTLREGLTIVTTNSALGGVGGGGTLVAGGATLRVANGITVTDEAVTLSGTAATPAVLELMTGNTTFGGQFNAVGTMGGEATIRTNGTSSLTVTGLLAGDAAIDKEGTGSLIIAGTNNNSNTGTLRINEGTAVFSKPAGVNAVSGAVIVGDNIGANNSATLTYLNGNQIADNRDLTVNEDGLYNLNGFSETIRGLTLTGAEVLTGTAALTIGGNVTTNASNTESIITGNLNIGTATRTFTVADGGAPVDLRVNAVISGGTGAGITKAGSGVMVLGSSNTYSGSTTVTAGALAAGAANAIPNSPLVVNGGSVVPNGFAVTVPQFSGTGGTLDLAVTGSSFTFGSDGTNQTFAGSVVGGATAVFTKTGTGTQTLSGNSSTYAGTTSVAGGALNVTGSLGGTTNVAAGATLSGAGTVGTVSAASGGTVSVGATATPATLTATGNVTLQGDTQFVIDVATAAFDRLTASGVVNLNGARLVLNVASLPTTGTSRTIVSGSSVTGNFRTSTGTVLSNGTTFTLNGRVFRVDQSANVVSLVFVSSLVSAAVTSNNNPATPSATNNITLTYTATAQNAADGTVMGTVAFFDVTGGGMGTQIGTNQTLMGGTASVMTSFATTGTRQIEARFTPAMGTPFVANTATLTQAVNNVTATTVTAAGGPVEFGTAVTLTATVTSTAMGAPTPNAGMVQFVNAANGAVLATAMVNASGVASTSAVLPAGRLTIAARYLGTGDFRASTATVQQLVSRQTLIATGAPAGSNGVILVLDGETRQQLLAISPFGAQGTKVAVGDVNNDGFSDLIVTQAAAVANPTIGIISGRDFSLLGVYQAIGFTGGVNIASGDVNGDGLADVIVGSATNGDLVRVYSGSSPNVIGQFNGMFGLNTGVTLAAGDIDGNGTAEIIVGTATQFFFAAAYNLSGAMVTTTPLAFAQAYTKGVNVAAGDLDGDGNAEIVLGLAADPTVVTFDPQTQALGLFDPGTAGGVSVSTTDVDGDGIAEILTAPTLGAPVIRRFNLFGALLEDLFGPVVGPTVASSPGQ